MIGRQIPATGPDYHVVQKRVRHGADSESPDWMEVAAPLRMIRLSGDRRQWEASGLDRRITHVVPTDLPEDGMVQEAYPNPDEGGGINRGRIALINCDQIPLGYDPGQCRKGDSVLVFYPDGVYRTRVYLGHSRVYNITTEDITETNSPGHRIVGKVLSHVAAQPNTATSTYTGALPD
jgi:hypothetical protein